MEPVDMRKCRKNASVTTDLPGELHILLPRAFHRNPQSEKSKWNILEVSTCVYHANALYQGSEIEEKVKLTAAKNVWDPIKECRQGGHCTICT